ncbi:N-6 DNA methylase [Virgibacillus xinjiangensis]|uniref:site-specific DNA-methyltransferase (adenine-specific) n=1 Tax=Virgibacillus xinjiangensis TaxID=393090 RepID=A0ABV7CVM2_9BACI
MKEMNFQKAVWQGMDILQNEELTFEESVHMTMGSLTLIVIEKLHREEVSEHESWSQVTRSGYNIKPRFIKAMEIAQHTFPVLQGTFNLEIIGKLDEGVLFQFVSVLNKYQHPEAEGIARITENFLYHFLEEQRSKAGQLIAPRSINELLSKLLGVQKGSVYDGTAGMGLLLLEAYKQAKQAGENVTVYAQDVNEDMAAIGKMNLFIHQVQSFEYEVGDTLTEPKFTDEYGLKTFDYVTMNFPFGLTWKPELVKNELYGRFVYGLPPKKSGDMAFILHAIASLKEQGKAAFIVPHGVLFRGGAEGKIREELIRNDLIEGVISLPSNLFSFTAIPLALLIVNKAKTEERKENIFFIDASAEFKKERGRNYLRDQDTKKIIETFISGKETPGYSKFVSNSDIQEGSLNIHRYFDVDDVDSPIGKVTVNRKSFLNSELPKKALHDVAEIYRGMNMPSKAKQEEEGTKYKVIQLTDVQDGDILWDQLQNVPLNDRRKAEQYFVQKGDILVSARGAAIKIAVVSEVKEDAILSHNFIGLRPMGNTHSQFLKAYLESPVGQYYLNSSQKGTAVKVISIKEIADVLVPALPYEKQKQIGESFEHTDKAYKLALQEAEEKRVQDYHQLYRDMEISVAFEQ